MIELISNELKRLGNEERPIQMRLFSFCLGVAAMKDLLNHDVWSIVFTEDGVFRYPFINLPIPGPISLWQPLFYGSQILAMVAAMFLMAQRFIRVASAVLFILYGYAFVVDRLHYTNNGYLFLLALGLLTLGAPGSTVMSPYYPRFLGRVVHTIVYTTAAIVKIEPNWLSGWLMEQSCRHYHHIYATKIAYYNPTLFQVIAVLTIALELFLAFGPWSRRAWPVAAIVGFSFHLIIEVLLPVRMFSWLMISFFLLSAPAEYVAPKRALRVLRIPSQAVLWGLIAVALIHIFWTRYWGAYPVAYNAYPTAAFAVAIAMAAVAFLPTQRIRRHFATILPTNWRNAIVALFVVIQIALPFKPLLGFDNEFAWRMFTEDLKMQVNTYTSSDGATWDASENYGALFQWPSRGYAHFWSSLQEQLSFLNQYADWWMDHDPEAKAVKMEIRYQKNQEPWQMTTVERRR